MNHTTAKTKQQSNARAQLKMVMRVMDLWQLTDAQRASVLALSDAERGQQAVFQQLLAIHKMLRLLFPANRQLAYRWMTSQNKAFDGAMPIEVIQHHGLDGVRLTQDYLTHFVVGTVTYEQQASAANGDDD